MPTPPHIRVHQLDHARCAVAAARAAGVEITLDSPAGAAGWHGIGWWRRLELAVTAEFGAVATVLDCADAPGHALAALRAGCRRIRLRAAAEPFNRVAAIAARWGAEVDSVPPAEVLDLLGVMDAPAACRDYLKKG